MSGVRGLTKIRNYTFVVSMILQFSVVWFNFLETNCSTSSGRE